MVEITNSQVRTFKNCRKRYYFEYVENLKPAVKSRALRFGSAYHTGLEALLKNEDVEKAIDLTYDSSDSKVDRATVLAAINHFDEQGYWKSWEILEVEKQFRVNMGFNPDFIGKIDAIAKVDGKLYVVEHKTAKTLNDSYIHHLLWDEQVPSYLKGARSLGYSAVVGILYNIIQKPTIRLKKNETEDEYCERVAEWYKAEKRITTHTIRRSERQLEEFDRELLTVIKDMDQMVARSKYYRNPSACQLLSCPFTSICLEDSPEARDINFVKKTRQNEELIPF